MFIFTSIKSSWLKTNIKVKLYFINFDKALSGQGLILETIFLYCLYKIRHTTVTEGTLVVEKWLFCVPYDNKKASRKKVGRVMHVP